jgi:hypothetical protein
VAPEATASNLELYKEPIPAILTFRLIGSSRGVTRFLHNLAVAGSRVLQELVFDHISSCKQNVYLEPFKNIAHVNIG